ncbi:helix-turn-helix transcriptional regulator [Streptomyces sp. RS10V-4]|uniref:Scr1 family TA system antitoxin-like transcriptional regulator n=1 Tax=Streptomyces rhizoryzae TaxID=2932493 RepID=UPI0020053166|nr:Scr1 family TA system antitoxin-like transcriptional regulator [Streptomyces rhizoryzae]MCK7626192.1 helix-turn-helix transcriptional regulator [Streptomyces rhizoryzae]
MPSSPSSSAQAARESVAERLKELRLDAELTTQELADRCGWHKAKTSRIENAKTMPSQADITAWCRACNVAEHAQDLIAASRSADSMYVEWRRLQRTGLRRLQEAGVPLYQRTARFRIYCSRLIPGLLQTEGYARALLATIASFRGLPDDSARAAAARVDRSRVIRDGHRRVVLVVEEDVLFHRVADNAEMAAQLGYLLAAMSYPAVSLGIIPRSVRRDMWGTETFTVFDDNRVHVELLTAKVTVTTPSEVTLYLAAFERLRRMAVYGAEARTLITGALDSLG